MAKEQTGVRWPAHPARAVTAKDAASVIARRLSAQQLARPALASPAEVVSWLGAVQAQDYAAAKWALGVRLEEGAANEVTIDRAVSEGAILRTHAMRWTWHFIAPADIRWILALVAPRLTARFASRHLQLGLDATTFRRSHSVIGRALRACGPLTRNELAAALGRSGIATDGPRLSHLLAHAELDALICSGAPRGKQPTYALLDQRVPGSPSPLVRGEALAELTRRYFRSRGPATLGDFIWWSGLTAAEARAGLEAVRMSLVADREDGQTYWRCHRTPSPGASHSAFLLPAFDEYLVAYRKRDAVLDPKQAKRLNAGGGMLGPCIVVDGRVVGTWRRTLARTAVTLELSVIATLTPQEHQAIAGAARRYGQFLGLDVRLMDLPRRRTRILPEEPI